MFCGETIILVDKIKLHGCLISLFWFLCFELLWSVDYLIVNPNKRDMWHSNGANDDGLDYGDYGDDGDAN